MAASKINKAKVRENLENILRIKVATVSVIGTYQIKIVKVFKEI